MPDWRTGWPAKIEQFRPDQIAAQADWATYGTQEDGGVDMHLLSIERQATMTVVNPVDPVASGLMEVPPGRHRQHGCRPIPAGRT